MTVIGLDIGGANLKASDGEADSQSRSFALWRQPDHLADALGDLVRQFGDIDAFAVTMTGELADCFVSREEGVHRILDAVELVAADRPVRVWQTAGEFVPPEVAREFPQLTAAANWHALATWVGRSTPAGDSLLLDIGSTTTDIIPLEDGLPMPRGRTDIERLLSGELAYSGVRRTPLPAIAHSVPFREGYGPLAAEFFACTQDIYLWLGDLVEDADNTETADGRPATRSAALGRLARALCCDLTGFFPEDADTLAAFLADVQQRRILGCVDRVLARMRGHCRMVVISGEGEFLAKRIVAAQRRLKESSMLSLAETIGPGSSRAACAWALARLGREDPFS